MGGETRKDYSDVISLMQMFSAPPGNEDGINHFFQETRKLFNSDELVFLHPADSRSNGIDLEHSFSLRGNNAFLSKYADHFWRYDPLYQAQFGLETSVRAFRTEDVMPIGHFVKLKYYYDFLQPQGLLSELVIKLYFKSQFLGAISLLRAKQRPVFDESDVRKAEMLIPYFASTIDIGDIFTKNIYEKDLCEQWMESQSEGMVLLDHNFHTLYRNSKAEIFCLLMTGREARAARSMEALNIPVPDIVIQDCSRLARSFSSGDSQGYDNRIVNLSGRNRYHLQYFTFGADESDNSKPGFIIVINDLSRYNKDAEEIVVSQGRLSNREAIVARYAGMGWTNKEIADSIHSSPFTIQNQLKSVFEKTGLKNRTQLASLMKYSETFPME